MGVATGGGGELFAQCAGIQHRCTEQHWAQQKVRQRPTCRGSQEPSHSCTLTMSTTPQFTLCYSDTSFPLRTLPTLPTPSPAVKRSWVAGPLLP